MIIVKAFTKHTMLDNAYRLRMFLGCYMRQPFPLCTLRIYRPTKLSAAT